MYWCRCLPVLAVALLHNGGESRPQPDPQHGNYPDCGIRFRGKGDHRNQTNNLAQPGEWTWTVALMRELDEYPLCAGSLITNRHVLTAAHCVHRSSPSELQVRAGYSDITKANEATDSQVENIVIHPEFNNSNHYADIAILELRTALPTNELISVACLPKNATDHTGRTGYVVGWATSEQSQSEDIRKDLRYEEMNIISNAVCSDKFAHIRRDIIFKNTSVCAQRSSGDRLPLCRGHSGGPLIVKDEQTKHWILEGLVSFGLGACGSSKYPEVHTRVSNFVDWISANVDFARQGGDSFIYQFQKGGNNSQQESGYYIYKFQQDCGVRFRATEGQRILGGSLARPGEWTWTVAILHEGVNHPFCGGSLITDRHVLTAAHCVEGLQASKLKILAGQIDLNKANPSQYVEVDNIIMHSAYDTDTWDADIAILKLRRTLPMTRRISVTCLPDERDHAGQVGYVIGWGATTPSSTLPSQRLLHVAIGIQTNAECSKKHERSQRPITHNMVCAGRRAQIGFDSCEGDSGGPLMVEDIRTKRWFLEGIVSWGPVPCGDGNRPGVYARVASFIDWIIKNAV